MTSQKMQAVDFIAAYWLAVKLLLYADAIVILISGIDDAFIDAYYWLRRIYRAIVVRRWPPLAAEDLYAKAQQPIALMVPAWQESGVIGAMADNTARTFDYDNYHIFIGTYPNDPETQAAVDEVAGRYANVHKVVAASPGPTTKADCLNNVIAAIADWEFANGVEFTCLAYHDAEDVVHPLELRLFNFLIPRKDLVQLPVLPLPRRLLDLAGGHYMDEFAEWHGKDMIVRESLTGNVPSAGVATGFSRSAVRALAEKNSGVVFNTESLTEDYEIGFRLQSIGAKGAFVRFPVFFRGTPPSWARAVKDRELVIVREYFPGAFATAVRQKSRWIVGIVFQGWKSLGWAKSPGLAYMMYRDRKGIVSNLAILIAYFLVANVLAMNVAAWRGSNEAWHLPALIPAGSWLWTLLMIDGVFMLNRLAHRVYFTARIYGPAHGLMAIPRSIVSNLVNVAAFFRALSQVRAAALSGGRVVWDKTTHQYPDPQTRDAGH